MRDSELLAGLGAMNIDDVMVRPINPKLTIKGSTYNVLQKVVQNYNATHSEVFRTLKYEFKMYVIRVA